MISRSLKVKPTREQEARLEEWFQIATGVWNWAWAKYDAYDRAMRSGPKPEWAKGAKTPKSLKAAIPGAFRPNHFSLCQLASGHGPRVGMNAMVLEAILADVDTAWSRYWNSISGRPRRKGVRNRIASIAFRQNRNTVRWDSTTRFRIPSIGPLRTRKHRDWPEGGVRVARLHRKPRGWYLTVVMDAEPRAVPTVADGAVGVDFGFSELATLSTGEKIANPREYERLQRRLGQAQRGQNRRLFAKLQQRLALARRSRNHQISRDLVGRFDAIYVSRDNLRGMARRFGKSVNSAAHYQLLEMLKAKGRQAGRRVFEVPNKNSTRTCHDCGALTGPHGLRGLKVREWACACGAHHDRDVNAARNTLILGAVLALESGSDPASEIRAA